MTVYSLDALSMASPLSGLGHERPNIEALGKYQEIAMILETILFGEPSSLRMDILDVMATNFN